MNKRIIKIMTTLTIISIFANSVTHAIYASEMHQQNVEYRSEDNRIKIVFTSSSATVIDTLTGETATINFSDETLTDEHGNIYSYKIDQQDFYLDNQKVITGTEIHSIPNNIYQTREYSLSTRSEWRYINTYRYRKSANLNAASFVAGIIALFGGPAGWVVSALSSILAGTAFFGKEAYIEIKQYQSTIEARLFKEEISVYRNSDYTGLVSRTSGTRYIY